MKEQFTFGGALCGEYSIVLALSTVDRSQKIFGMCHELSMGRSLDQLALGDEAHDPILEQIHTNASRLLYCTSMLDENTNSVQFDPSTSLIRRLHQTG